jgi:hypothetical protein
MVNVTVPLCQAAGCPKIPTFNKPGSSKGKFCKTHSEPDMVRLFSSTCQNAKCTTQPSFGDVVTGKRMYCKLHALAGMINVKRRKLST